MALRHDFKFHWETSFFIFVIYKIYTSLSLNQTIEAIKNIFIDMLNMITWRYLMFSCRSLYDVHCHHFTDLSCFQKSAMLTSIFLAIYHLVTKFPWIKTSQFKVALKRYLNTHSFYTVDKFLLSKNDSYSTRRFVLRA
jgi:hypothetical protein